MEAFDDPLFVAKVNSFFPSNTPELRSTTSTWFSWSDVGLTASTPSSSMASTVEVNTGGELQSVFDRELFGEKEAKAAARTPRKRSKKGANRFGYKR